MRQIGPIALKIAEPAGLVMKGAMDGTAYEVLTGRRLGKVARELAPRAPEIDLERVPQPLLPHRDPQKRRIREEPAIPIVLAFDLDHWKASRGPKL
jgi:hypothetical protein